ncbi:MAG: hypothetical protein EPGJADBJ_00411 [Saprospiraceae bacterium]|nr:hypothetical protein [Saprospiraceae bacterium]
MSDYRFDVLSILVKHDDFVEDNKLFGEDIKKYEETLEVLYVVDLIERITEVNGIEVKKTKVTFRGRNYYYDELLPRRQQILQTNTPNQNEKKQPNKYIRWVLFNKDIIGIILTIIGIILAILAL